MSKDQMDTKDGKRISAIINDLEKSLTYEEALQFAFNTGLRRTRKKVTKELLMLEAVSNVVGKHVSRAENSETKKTELSYADLTYIKAGVFFCKENITTFINSF